MTKPPTDPTLIQRTVTLRRCLRCGNEWLPRVATPVKCPACKSYRWAQPYAYRIPGRPAPTRKGQPRGRTIPKTRN